MTKSAATRSLAPSVERVRDGVISAAPAAPALAVGKVVQVVGKVVQVVVRDAQVVLEAPKAVADAVTLVIEAATVVDPEGVVVRTIVDAMIVGTVAANAKAHRCPMCR
jgi:hypothetical protein